MMKASVLALLSASVLTTACGPTGRDDGTGGGGDGDGSGSDGDGSGSGTAQACDKMDIVFVVDDSGSMEEEQTNLASNFPMFANQIAAYTTPDGVPLDFRIALTTTGRTVDYTVAFAGYSIPEHEDGANGTFLDGCGSQMRWLEPGDANLQSTLACRANVGTGGPGIEMPLLMSKYALAERVADGTNVGFLRPDALLAVVMLTDEDDSSTTQNNFTMDETGTTPLDFNPQDLVNFLDTTKGNRSRWAAGVIAGDGDCSSDFGSAANGARLKEFVNLANQGGYQQATFSSICAGDLSAGLQQALNLFQTACGQIIL